MSYHQNQTTTEFLDMARSERDRLLFQLSLMDSLLRVYEKTGDAHLPRSRDPKDVLLDEDFDALEICK